MSRSHQEVSQQARVLFSSKQVEAFRVESEPAATLDRTNPNWTRAAAGPAAEVEAGVPPSWRSTRAHGISSGICVNRVFPLLRNGLPPLDQAFSGAH